MADLRFPRLNKIIISGRITNDIELRYTAKGTPVVRFTIAVDKPVKDDSGQYQNQACFFEVVAWSKWAESLNNNSHKGSPVIVEGRLDARSYVDNNNQNRKVVEIIAEYIQFLEFKSRTDENGQPESHEAQAALPEDETSHPQVTNDDVPF
jgi:single-strand DNA-binding protein